MSFPWQPFAIAFGLAFLVAIYLALRSLVQCRREAQSRRWQHPLRRVPILPEWEEYELSVRRPRLSLYHNVPALPTLPPETPERTDSFMGTPAPPAALLAHREAPRQLHRPRSLLPFLRKQYQPVR